MQYEKNKTHEDVWCSKEPFSVLFPMLYTLASYKEAKVKEVWRLVGEQGGWDLRFERHFNDWELEKTENLFDMIKDKKIHSLEKDRRAWKLTKDGRFSVKSSFDFLEGERDRTFPKKIILEQMCSFQSGLLCLGILVGKSLNNGSA